MASVAHARELLRAPPEQGGHRRDASEVDVVPVPAILAIAVTQPTVIRPPPSSRSLSRAISRLAADFAGSHRNVANLNSPHFAWQSHHSQTKRGGRERSEER